MNSHCRELSVEELNAASAGSIDIVVDKGYVGVEVHVGGYGFAVWTTGGSVCGATYTPTHTGGSCTP